MSKSFIKFILFLLILAIIISGWWYFDISKNQSIDLDLLDFDTNEVKTKKDRVEKIEIIDGSTFGVLMSEAGLDYETETAIYTAAQPLYDLVKIRVGRTLDLVYDKDTDELKKLLYKIDSEDELIAFKTTTSTPPTSTTTASTTTPQNSKKETVWVAEIKPIAYEVKQKIAEGTVESSMYQAALDNNIDIRAIIELANAFQWTIDFAIDPRVGDTFKFIYEERYLNGEYIMPGQILAGKYVNDGESFEIYYFEETEENQGFFDLEGNSVQKMFLKSPVAFKYISSGFTTGLRCLESLHMCTNHRAIDYAANCATPIRAVGDGTITFAGWNSQGYGNFISIHHNGTYSTNYAHLSKFAVKKGQKVEQGQTIGYVGTTGLSTGCHLHYEMVKHGTKINPQYEILPPGDPIKEENRERYFEEIKKWQEELNK
ncbi:peptidoglycan DD-metalloendopeptidase family protein [Patescibacteria group bacterium]